MTWPVPGGGGFGGLVGGVCGKTRLKKVSSRLSPVLVESKREIRRGHVTENTGIFALALEHPRLQNRKPPKKNR